METDISKLSDHDLLITMHEQIRGIKADIKDLKDGTSSELEDHEKRLRSLEDYKNVQSQSLRDNKRYMQFLIALGIILLGILIYHLTGYKI